MPGSPSPPGSGSGWPRAPRGPWGRPADQAPALLRLPLVFPSPTRPVLPAETRPVRLPPGARLPGPGQLVGLFPNPSTAPPALERRACGLPVIGVLGRVLESAREADGTCTGTVEGLQRVRALGTEAGDSEGGDDGAVVLLTFDRAPRGRAEAAAAARAERETRRVAEWAGRHVPSLLLALGRADALAELAGAEERPADPYELAAHGIALGGGPEPPAPGPDELRRELLAFALAAGLPEGSSALSLPERLALLACDDGEGRLQWLVHHRLSKL